MKILVLGLNYAPEPVGIAVYTAGMSEALAAKGHEVRAVVGQPYYPEWHISDGYSRFWFSKAIENGVFVTRCPHYVPHNPSLARRLIHYITFAFASLFPLVWSALKRRPDVVIAIAPALVAAPVARVAAWLCGAKAWLHIQDFEVDAAIGTGQMSSSGWVVRFAHHMERMILNSFDKVSTISPQMCRKLFDKDVAPARVVEFRNWADLDQVQPLSRPSRWRELWGIDTPYVVLYSGNIAAKQGIEIIVEAARRLRHRTDLTFVICGDGANREKLEAMSAGLPNIQLHGLQPREQLGELLALASVHLLPQLAGAADTLLPSKLTNILASGRPVVATAAPESSLAIEIEGCGIATPPGDAAAFADAIELLLDDAPLHVTLSRAAHARALERWSPDVILSTFDKQLRRLAEPSPGPGSA